MGKKGQDAVLWMGIVFFLAMWVLCTAGCAALRGQQAYKGTGSKPHVWLETHRFPAPQGGSMMLTSWESHTIASVGNPTDKAVKITLDCTGGARWADIEVPPHTSQSFLLDATEGHCSVTW